MSGSSKRSSAKASAASKKTEPELVALETATLVDLRSRWLILFSTEPPRAFGPALLRHGIAHGLQERAYGQMPRSTQRLLDQMIRGISNKATGKLDLSRQIKPGSELIRTWKGKTHRVIVKDEGFAYGGKTYLGLSEIASSITGTRWNGPRFFGLRSKVDGVTPNGQ